MMWIRGLEEKALERTQGNVEHLRSFKPERCLFSSRLYGHIHSKVRSDTLPPVGLSASAQPNNFRRMRYTRRGRLYRRPEPGISGENLQYRELDRLINRNNVDEDDSGAVAEDDVSKDDGEIRAKQENDPSSDVASWLKTSKPSKDFYEDYEKKEYDEDFLVRYLEEASFETIFPLENKIEESFGLYEYSTECLANFARAGGIYFSEEQHFPFKGEGIAFRVRIIKVSPARAKNLGQFTFTVISRS